MSVKLGPGASPLGSAAGSPAVSPGPNANLARRVVNLEEEFFEEMTAGNLDDQVGMGGTWHNLPFAGGTDTINVDATSQLGGVNSITNIEVGHNSTVVEQKSLRVAGGPADEVVVIFRAKATAAMLPGGGATVSTPIAVSISDLAYPTNAAALSGTNDVLDFGVGRTAGGNMAIQFFDRENPAGTAFFDTGIALGTGAWIAAHVFPDHTYRAYVSSTALTPAIVLQTPPAQISPVGDHVDVNGTGHTAMVAYNVEYQAALVPNQPSNVIYLDTFEFYKVPVPAQLVQGSQFFDGEFSTAVFVPPFGTIAVQASGPSFTDGTSSIALDATIDGVNWFPFNSLVGAAGGTNVKVFNVAGYLAIRFRVSLPHDTTLAGVTIVMGVHL